MKNQRFRTFLALGTIVCLGACEMPEVESTYEVVAVQSYSSANSAAAGLTKKIQASSERNCRPVDIAAGAGDPGETYVTAFVLLECRVETVE